jgi:RNA polymerase sigma-70 factor (ECF subfamily)
MADGGFVRGKDREREWASLMRAGKAGDGASYRALLRELTPALRAVARRSLQRAGMAETDAEDIVQDTLLAIHLKRQTWDEDAPISPWIFAITRHKIIDALRRRGRRIDLPIEDFAESLHNGEPEPSLIVGDVDRHLDALPQGQRNVVKLIAIDGASIDHAALKLKMSKGAVRVALHRGLARLAAHFRTDET